MYFSISFGAFLPSTVHRLLHTYTRAFILSYPLQHYISGFFGTTVHVEHVDRVSNDMAELADELLRKASSSKGRALRALKDAKFRAVEGSLVDWLRDPCGKMDLCSELLKEIKKSSS